MAVQGIADPALAVAALDHTWFGARLGPEAQARLAALATHREAAPGSELVREGELCKDLSIVLKGRVALRMLVPERGMVTILTVEPGDIVGWSALVPPHRAMSTAVVVEAAELLTLDGESLRSSLRADHALAASVYPRVLQAVGRRLEGTRLQLLDLFAREARSDIPGGER